MIEDAGPGHQPTLETVRPASNSEVPAIARLLTGAFADDPIERWCLACDDRPTLLELEFLQVTAQIVPKGWLWVVGDLEGVAAWFPPDAGYDDAAIDAVVNPVLAEHGGCPKRRTGFWAWAESHRPDGFCWYLDLLGVAPDHRRSQRGGLLLRHGLRRVDARGESVFLVTGNPWTVRWYERHGFTMFTAENAPAGGPRVWFMVRSPVEPRHL